MADERQAVSEQHTKLILERYKGEGGVLVHPIAPQALIDKYLSKVMSPAEIEGKRILELGAGCSTYVPVFLDNGCTRYYANDIIPARLASIRVSDPRYVEAPGDFRKIELPERVDIVFASLMMMMVVPMHDEFIAKIADSLVSGGLCLTMDANYLCPFSVYRRFADRRVNPVRLFNPFAYANKFRRHGFKVEKLVPFTAAYPATIGNWLAGTTFWLRARKL